MKPLKIYNKDENEPSACHVIRCHETGISSKWNDACRAGWVWIQWNAETKKHEYLSPDGILERAKKNV